VSNRTHVENNRVQLPGNKHITNQKLSYTTKSTIDNGMDNIKADQLIDMGLYLYVYMSEKNLI
jgi:hypothetical protein